MNELETLYVTFLGVNESGNSECAQKIVTILNDHSSTNDWTTNAKQRAHRVGPQKKGGVPPTYHCQKWLFGLPSIDFTVFRPKQVEGDNHETQLSKWGETTICDKWSMQEVVVKETIKDIPYGI